MPRVHGQMNVIASVVLKLHDNGAMSIEGNIGDLNMALGMLESAKDALTSKIGKPTTLEPHGAGLVLPPSYVDAPANEKVYPLVAEGDADYEASKAKARALGKTGLERPG